MADIRLKKITVETNQSPLIVQGGDINVTNTTASLSVLQGAIISNGGVSINTTYDSSSSTSGGALTVAGGVGIMKCVFIGQDLNLDSSNGIIRVKGLTENRLFLDTISNKNFYISPDGTSKRFELTDTNLVINITANSTSKTEAALYVKGGISIGSDENVTNGSNGGALTVAGGVAVGKNLNVSSQVLLGENNSNKSGMTVRYTGTDQILLHNSTTSNASSFNMLEADLVIGNDSDIIVRTSSGNIMFENTTTAKTMISIHNDHTEFLEPVHISNTINSTSGVLVIDGSQTITTTSQATSITNGGSFTTLGGMAIGKRLFTGDSIGINIANDSVNKLVLYQKDSDLSQANLFTGLGSISGGSLLYQISNTNASHIFYSTETNPLFKICGNNDIVFTGKDQSYIVRGGGKVDSALSYQSTTSDSSINFFTHNGLATTNNDIQIFGKGLPNDTENSEALKIGWNGVDYIVSVNNFGTGIKQHLVIESGIENQMIVKADGTIGIYSTATSLNSSTGALVIQNGGLSINTTQNASNIDNGGGLTIAGGSSIAKDLLLGGDLVLNASKTSEFKLTTRIVDSTYSCLQIMSDVNKHPSIHLTKNSPVSAPFDVSLYSLGSSDSANYERLQINTHSDLSGYIIRSVYSGSGQPKYISAYSGIYIDQFVLQTSGNVGISIHDPEYKLDISGTLRCDDRILFTSSVNSVNSTTASLVLSGGIGINSTKEAESLTRGGALTVAGGVSVGKNMVVGGITEFLDETPSTSVMNASVIVNGGLSIKSGQDSANTLNGGGLTVAGGGAFTGDLYVGGSINGSGSSSSTYAYLTLTATDDAINLSTGTLVSLGGLTLQSDTNSVDISNGGTILTPGGASIGKDVYIGGSVFMTRGVSNYYTEDNSLVNFYDSFNIKRFSIDRSSSTQNFSITRYDSLGNEVEKSIDISNSNGVVAFNNILPSSDKDNASVIFNGGVSISTTSDVINVSQGGSLTIAGGTSISKRLFVGGDVVYSSSTPSDNVSTGALLITGGVGVSGNLNVLGNTMIVGNLTVNGSTTSIETTNTTLKDNIFMLNSGPTGSNDSGWMVERYQQDNNIGSGDVVADVHPSQSLTLPDQSGMESTQIKLNTNANAINDHYKGWWVRLASGFSNNQVRKITGYNGSTKIATLSSGWLNQNPSIGDSVNIYNKPYVGVVYNEINDRFEFGSSVQDPNEKNIVFTDHVPLCFSSATSVSTDISNSISSGSIQIAGGISISNTSNATSVTRGGTFTTLGGASIGKNLYVGDNLYVNGANMTPSPYDMFSTRTFNGADNMTSFTDITGLIFDTLVWGFDCYLAVQISASTNSYVNFHIRGVNKISTWEIIKTYVGDDTGIQFNITDFGQIQYTTPHYHDFTSIVFKWRALVN